MKKFALEAGRVLLDAIAAAFVVAAMRFIVGDHDAIYSLFAIVIFYQYRHAAKAVSLNLNA